MIKFSHVKPFISELIILAFIVVVVWIGIVNEYFSITFEMNLLTLGLLVFFAGVCIFVFSRVLNLGIRAFIDFVFQRTTEKQLVFHKIIPYRASVLSEKFENNGERSIGMYYLIEMSGSDHMYTYISPVYLDLKENQEYLTISTSSSHILISAIPKGPICPS